MLDYDRPLNSYAVTARKSLRKLKEYLSASITSRYSNGRIKLLKRISYGLRNWTRFRNRIFMILNKSVAK
ncbi:transposase [Weissella confusa]|uniref:transposase n=1 Tax=Weissella confusa TaxID=1583 RepID=UPI003A5C3DDB